LKEYFNLGLLINLGEENNKTDNDDEIELVEE
jgi:hypothetical protein